MRCNHSPCNGLVGMLLVSLAFLYGCETAESGPTPDDGSDVLSDTGGSDLPDGGGSELAVDVPLDSAPETTAQPALAIVGIYADDWGTEHRITDEGWTMGYGPQASLFHIRQYANDDRYIIAENDDHNPYHPGLWSRFDWTEHDAFLWFCQTAFAAKGEADALAVPPADPTDPASGGCGQFAWSKLTPGQGPLAIRGTYTDSFGGEHVIDEGNWTMGFGDDVSVFQISQYSNVGSYVIASNHVDNSYNPGMWSRFDWTWHDSRLFYCQTAYAAVTEEDALSTPPPDSSDPSTGGCGGFPWSELKP